MIVSERIAQIRFELVLDKDVSNELLDDIENALKGKDEIYFPLRVFTISSNGKHLFARIEIKLNKDVDLIEYTENILYILREFGEVRDLYVR